MADEKVEKLYQQNLIIEDLKKDLKKDYDEMKKLFEERVTNLEKMFNEKIKDNNKKDTFKDHQQDRVNFESIVEKLKGDVKWTILEMKTNQVHTLIIQA